MKSAASALTLLGLSHIFFPKVGDIARMHVPPTHITTASCDD
jgi:hypothetical protein